MRRSKRKEQAAYDDDGGPEVHSDPGADDNIAVDEPAPEAQSADPTSEAEGDDTALDDDDDDNWKAVLQKKFKTLPSYAPFRNTFVFL